MSQENDDIVAAVLTLAQVGGQPNKNANEVLDAFFTMRSGLVTRRDRAPTHPPATLDPDYNPVLTEE